MKNWTQVFVALFLCGSLAGCASFGKSFKSFLSGDSKKKKRRAGKTKVGKVKKKNYKRMDHPSLQEQSRLGANSGSLWIERGQGAYLFTQNTNRLIGDLINVNIEGHPKDQIETKVKVIENLIARIKAQKEARKLASQAQKTNGQNGAAAGGKPKEKTPAAPPAPKKKSNAKFSVKTVPSRITEIMKDGSYLVQGEQPFMLGKREYRLLVKGIVRQEDFDDQGISAETLLDPKFDIVTSKRKGKRL